MTSDKKLPQICVVCYANYCRSPVAMYLLQKKFDGKFIVLSAGLNPINNIGMDPRSEGYLRSLNIDFKLHVPKKLDSALVSDSQLILALDPFILMQLNKKFPNQSKKIKLMTYQNTEIVLTDPYKFDEKNYLKIMQNIDKVIENLNI